MDYILAVTVTEGLEQLLKQLGALNFREPLLLSCNLLEQVASRAVLHAQLDVLFVVVGFEVLYYVRVVDLLHDLDLSLHIALLVLRQFLFVHDFNRDSHGRILFVLG